VRSAVTAPEPASEAQATRPTERVRLPVPPTELIGREDEIAAAMAVLDPARSAVRLLTLTGPGEVGKTRLALAVASALADAYADGVVFVDLAPQRDARPVPATIARSLEVRESGGRSAHDLLLDHLRDKHALLVLDNCEHVLAAAPLLSELLAAGPRLALLATSRAALRLRGEQRFPVRSLATPAAEPSLEAIAAAPAVRLFVERAQAVAPDFVLDASTASAVAAICSHLDGLPLAIELAAARTRLLGPAALLGRLERPLPVLMGGRATCRTASRRYATHWPGVTLCSARADPVPAARAVCRRWTLEAAEAVCSGADLPGDEVLDRLTALVDASLVHRLDNPTSEPRFGMLETVREYAREQLEARDEAADQNRRHAAYSLAWAQAAAPELFGAAQLASLERLDCEHENLRAALSWYLERQPAAAVALAGWLWPFWRLRPPSTEGLDWLSRALTRAPEQTVAWARAALGAGILARNLGQMATAQAHLAASLACSRALGEPALAAWALRDLGQWHIQQGAFGPARRLLREGLRLARAAGDQHGVAAARGCSTRRASRPRAGAATAG
jgi:predicted ATPase